MNNDVSPTETYDDLRNLLDKTLDEMKAKAAGDVSFCNFVDFVRRETKSKMNSPQGKFNVDYLGQQLNTWAEKSFEIPNESGSSTVVIDNAKPKPKQGTSKERRNAAIILAGLQEKIMQGLTSASELEKTLVGLSEDSAAKRALSEMCLRRHFELLVVADALKIPHAVSRAENSSADQSDSDFDLKTALRNQGFIKVLKGSLDQKELAGLKKEFKEFMLTQDLPEKPLAGTPAAKAFNKFKAKQGSHHDASGGVFSQLRDSVTPMPSRDELRATFSEEKYDALFTQFLMNKLEAGGPQLAPPVIPPRRIALPGVLPASLVVGSAPLRASHASRVPSSFNAQSPDRPPPLLSLHPLKRTQVAPAAPEQVPPRPAPFVERKDKPKL